MEKSQLPSVTEDVLLICLVIFETWALDGSALRDLVAAAQPREGAASSTSRLRDEEEDPARQHYFKEDISAYRVNGEPLPKKHGFPLRLVYGDAYGSEWIKYVEEIVWPRAET